MFEVTLLLPDAIDNREQHQKGEGGFVLKYDAIYFYQSI